MSNRSKEEREHVRETWLGHRWMSGGPHEEQAWHWRRREGEGVREEGGWEEGPTDEGGRME